MNIEKFDFHNGRILNSTRQLYMMELMSSIIENKINVDTNVDLQQDINYLFVKYTALKII